MSLKHWLDNGWLRPHTTSLTLCTILLCAEGYRSERTLQHYRTIQSLPIILGEDRKDDAAYLDACRSKRNRVEYDYVGGASEDDAEELLAFTRALREDVLSWLRAKHPEYLPA